MTKNKQNGPRDKYLEFVNIAFQMGIIIVGVFMPAYGLTVNIQMNFRDLQ
jgi:hypothetical protein